MENEQLLKALARELGLDLKFKEWKMTCCATTNKSDKEGPDEVLKLKKKHSNVFEVEAPRAPLGRCRLCYTIHL